MNFHKNFNLSNFQFDLYYSNSILLFIFLISFNNNFIISLKSSWSRIIFLHDQSYNFICIKKYIGLQFYFIFAEFMSNLFPKYKICKKCFFFSFNKEFCKFCNLRLFQSYHKLHALFLVQCFLSGRLVNNHSSSFSLHRESPAF